MYIKIILIGISLFISLSLEMYGLYHIFNLSPYLLIGLLIAPFKVLYRDKKSIVLYAITLFFALQLPLLPLVEANKIKDSQANIQELINKKILLTEQNKFVLKSGGFGIYNNNNKEINNIDSKLESIKNNAIEVNYYKSLIEILIIFLVEYMLWFQLRNLKLPIKKPTIKTKKNNFTEIKI